MTLKGIISEHTRGTAILALLNGGVSREDIFNQQGRTLLHLAAADGNDEVVSCLLHGGAPTDDVDRNGCSPLHFAAFGGHSSTVGLLMDAGATSNLLEDKNGFAPLHAAAAGGQAEAVSALVLKGADKNVANRNGQTPLMLAIENGLSTVVDALLNAGVNVNFQHIGSGEGALYLASGYGHVGIVFALLQKGAIKDARDRNGRTALLAAAVNCHLDALNALLDAGADPNIASNSGITPLYGAALNGLCEVASALLRHDMTDVDVLSHSGNTPLCIAVSYGHALVVDALLNAGADVDKFDREQEEAVSPLAIAARNGDVGTTRVLLERGAKVGATDLYGSTALHWVCLKRPANAREVTGLLLRAGADETMKTCDDETPEDLLKDEAASPQCFAEEVEDVRNLLVRAPQDRAWRRRCWLVMLRSRDTAPEGKVSGACKLARSGGTEEGRVRDAQGSAKTKGGCDVTVVVKKLFALEVEGLFRKVVEFL